MFEKLKSNQYHIFLAICIGLISFISFNLGKISSSEKGEIKITQDANIYNAIEQQATNDQQQDEGKPTPRPLDMRVVVFKNSDKSTSHYCAQHSFAFANSQGQSSYAPEGGFLLQ